MRGLCRFSFVALTAVFVFVVSALSFQGCSTCRKNEPPAEAAKGQSNPTQSQQAQSPGQLGIGKGSEEKEKVGLSRDDSNRPAYWGLSTREWVLRRTMTRKMGEPLEGPGGSYRLNSFYVANLPQQSPDPRFSDWKKAYETLANLLKENRVLTEASPLLIIWNVGNDSVVWSIALPIHESDREKVKPPLEVKHLSDSEVVVVRGTLQEFGQRWAPTDEKQPLLPTAVKNGFKELNLPFHPEYIILRFVDKPPFAKGPGDKVELIVTKPISQ